MKVLVVGGGGREHAVVDALSRSPQVSKIYCAPGNAGIARQAECVPVKDTDVEGLLSLAREKEIDLTVVGPEAALVAGIVDRFREEGLRIFGPTKAAARIESSKEFAKDSDGAVRYSDGRLPGVRRLPEGFGVRSFAPLCPPS